MRDGGRSDEGGINIYCQQRHSLTQGRQRVTEAGVEEMGKGAHYYYDGSEYDR